MVGSNDYDSLDGLSNDELDDAELDDDEGGYNQDVQAYDGECWGAMGEIGDACVRHGYVKQYTSQNVCLS